MGEWQLLENIQKQQQILYGLKQINMLWSCTLGGFSGRTEFIAVFKCNKLLNFTASQNLFIHLWTFLLSFFLFMFSSLARHIAHLYMEYIAYAFQYVQLFELKLRIFVAILLYGRELKLVCLDSIYKMKCSWLI